MIDPIRTRRADVDVRRTRRPAQTAAAVLAAVLDHGPVARSTVARLTGISTASVSVATAQLIERGLLREAPEAAGPPGIGRPHMPLTVDTDRLGVVGVHIALEAVRVSLLDLCGRLVAERRVPVDRPTPEQVAEIVGAGVTGLRADFPERELLGMGVATGGWVDAEAGTVVSHPMLGWSEVPLRDSLARTAGLDVHLDSHARALVHAEQLFGRHALRARESVVQLFVGNVVDVAFGVGGRVHAGPRSAAGVVAHLPVPESDEPCDCGRTGCLEAVVSARTLLRKAVERGVLARPVNTDLMAAARSGDAGAVALYCERARHIGKAAALLLDLFNPEVLTVTASVGTEIPECMAELHAEVALRSAVCVDPEVSVVGTSFPGEFLSIAGGAVALERVYGRPTSRSVLSHAS